jgi:hypothetical protein
LDADWADSDNDIRHRLVGNLIWDLPLDFMVGVLLTYQSGYPFTVFAGSDVNNDGNGNDYAVIDDTNRERVRTAGLDLSDGLQGRNSAREPSFFNVDVRFGKTFDLGPGRFEVLIDVFNLFNHANRFTTVTSIAAPDFGSLNGLFSNPRQVQIGVRYRF